MAKKSLTQKPYLWADIIRIVAIFLVVQIHALADVGTYVSQANIFVRLSVVCVPLFILLSGSLLLGKHEDYITFFRKRIVKVLIPWIFWIFVYIYLDVVILKQPQTLQLLYTPHASFISTWSHIFIIAFLSRLWFLPLIFGLYILTPILRIIVQHGKKIDMLFYLTLWFLFASILPYIFHNALFPVYEPNLLLAPFQYSGMFVLGYLLVQVKKKFSLLLLLFITAILLGIPFLPIDNYYVKTFAFSYIDPGSLLAATTLFLSLYQIVEKLKKYISIKQRHIVALVSQASFGVYLVHEIVYVILVRLLIGGMVHSSVGLLIPLIIFVVSTVMVIVFKKVPFIKYLLP